MSFLFCDFVWIWLILLFLYLQYGLRQLDLSLLSQLWALNESIQEFRTMMQEQENLSPQSPSPSNSDLNSLASDDEDGTHEDNNNNNNLIINGNSPSVVSGKANGKQEHDFIEDMHQKLEKQIQRMRIAPPAPPNRKPSQKLQSPSRPVWSNSHELVPSCNIESFFDKVNQLFCVNKK